jgi:hypothetical protein
MAFYDWGNKPELADLEPNCTPENNWRVWVHCPNLKHIKNDTDPNGEWYKCKKCGRIEFADYDETR